VSASRAVTRSFPFCRLSLLLLPKLVSLMFFCRIAKAFVKLYSFLCVLAVVDFSFSSLPGWLVGYVVSIPHVMSFYTYNQLVDFILSILTHSLSLFLIVALLFLSSSCLQVFFLSFFLSPLGLVSSAPSMPFWFTSVLLGFFGAFHDSFHVGLFTQLRPVATSHSHSLLASSHWRFVVVLFLSQIDSLLFLSLGFLVSGYSLLLFFLSFFWGSAVMIYSQHVRFLSSFQHLAFR